MKRAISALVGVALACCTLSVQQPASAANNGCGPEDYGLLVPDGPFPFLSLFDAFDTFKEACDAHDTCYGNENVDQVECDRRLYAELLKACERDYSEPFLSYCESVASLFHDAVSNFGEISKRGVINGQILQVNHRRIRHWWGDDEFEACVTFTNNGMVNTEYDLVLYASTGRQIDTEPDTYEVNVKVGEQARLCVGTNGIYPSIRDLGRRYSIALRVDAPNTGFQEVTRFEGATP